MLVRECMTPDPTTMQPADPASLAYQRMREGKFRHLPVVEGDSLVGILTERNLRHLLPISANEETSENWMHRMRLVHVGDLMTRDPVAGYPDMPVEEAARVLYERKFGSLPIVEGGRLVGIVTVTDIFRVFVALTGVLEPSSRLTISLPGDGDPSDVVGLIHETGVRIVSLLTEAGAEPSARRLVVRVATIDPRPIVTRLQDQGITVTLTDPTE